MHTKLKVVSGLVTMAQLGALYLAVACPVSAQVVENLIGVAPIALPYAVEVNEVTNKVYVGEAAGNGYYQGAPISVIQGASLPSNTIANSTDASTMAVNSVTNKIYAGAFYSGFVQVIDGSTDTFAKTINLGSSTVGVEQIFVDPSSNTVYAAAITDSGAAMFVINGSTDTVASTFDLPSQIVPVPPASTLPPLRRTMAIDVAHHKLYGIDTVQSTLYIVDLAAQTVSQVLGSQFDSGSVAVAVDSALNKIYVLNNSNISTNTGTIAVFDGATATHQTSRIVGVSPKAMVINPVTHLVFVANGSGSITVLDESSLYPYTVDGATAAVTYNAWTPTSMAVDTSSNKIYLSSLTSQNGYTFSSYIVVLNGNNLQTSAIPLFSDGGNFTFMTVNSTTHAVYVAQNANPNISVVDGTGGSTPYPTLFPQGQVFFMGAGLLVTPSMPATIYVANTGSQPMTITNLVWQGTYPPALVQSNNCPNPLPAGSSCPITLQLVPDANTPSTDMGFFYVSVANPSSTTPSLAIRTATTP